MSADNWENSWASFVFHWMYSRDNCQKRKQSCLQTPNTTQTWSEMFFFLSFDCQLLGRQPGDDAGMRQEAVIGTWLNSSRRKNNMPLWINQNTTRSHNTTQHAILPLLSFSCSFSPWMFFFCLAVCSFCPFPLHLPCCAHTNWTKCRVPWVHSRSSGSSPPAPGLHNQQCTFSYTVCSELWQMSQHVRYQDPETEADKWNPASINVVIYSWAFHTATCQNVFYMVLNVYMLLT